MLLAGMVIADVPLKIVFTKKRNYLSTVLRLIVYPIFVLILMKLIHTFAGINDSKQILLTVYIASITPACATVTSMAQLYDKDAAYASSLYVLTTLLSIVTMPVMVGMYEMFVCENRKIEEMTLTSVGVFYFHGPVMSRLIEYFVKITFQMLKAFYIAEYKSIMIIDRREKRYGSEYACSCCHF